MLSLVNQYGKGIVSAESAYVRMKLTDMLNDNLMDCSYDMLGDKKVMQSLSQASATYLVADIQDCWSMQVEYGCLLFSGGRSGSLSCGVVKASILGNPILIAATVVSFSDIRLWRKDTTEEAQRLFW